ncbi:MAG: hypothetical protein ACP5O2_07490 [Bacteroidales bacterium]
MVVGKNLRLPGKASASTHTHSPLSILVAKCIHRIFIQEIKPQRINTHWIIYRCKSTSIVNGAIEGGRIVELSDSPGKQFQPLNLPQGMGKKRPVKASVGGAIEFGVSAA